MPPVTPVSSPLISLLLLLQLSKKFLNLRKKTMLLVLILFTTAISSIFLVLTTFLLPFTQKFFFLVFRPHPSPSQILLWFINPARPLIHLTFVWSPSPLLLEKLFTWSWLLVSSLFFCPTNLSIHPYKKAFLSKINGCLEHCSVLNSLLLHARTQKKTLHCTWFDLADAFGYISYSSHFFYPLTKSLLSWNTILY